MKSPFPYESLAKKDTFYGRDKEKKQIKQYISSSNNLLIYSKRRMGKSTLVQEVYRSISEDTTCIYIDIFDITSEYDFAKILLKGISSAKKGSVESVFKWLTKLFKKTKFEPTLDPQSGRISLKPIVEGMSFEEMIDEAFMALFEMTKVQKVALAMDEFQQISTIKNVKIDALIRKYIQEPYGISYIFLGSKRHLLNSLFEYKAPLYEMATPLHLEHIEFSEIFSYVKQYLNIDERSMRYLFEVSDKETKLMQHLLHLIYVEYGDEKNISLQDIDDTLKELLLMKQDSYKIIFDQFTLNQKKVFKLLGQDKQNLLNNEYLKKQNITKSSMQTALRQLFEKEYIDKRDNAWYIPDRLFELWCKYEFGKE